MTVEIKTLDGLDLSLLSKDEKDEMYYYERLKNETGKVILKVRETKKGKFLLAYVYDKAFWKYFLKCCYKIG